MAQVPLERSIGSLNRRTLLKGAAVAGAATSGLSFPAFVRAQDPLRVAFSVPGLNFPFFVHMTKLAEEYAASLGGIEFQILDGQEQGQPSSTKQTADLEAMITEGIDGLVISPNDVAALAPGIQAVLDADIPVVTVDRNVTDVATLAHVGADNVKGGEAQGNYLVQILPDGGNIYELMGQPGSSAAIDRNKGLMNILNAQDKIKVIVSQTAEFQRAEAVTVFEAALAGNDPPDAVVCANDDMAYGVIEVAKAQGLTIPIIGFDANPEALVAIDAGDLTASVEQFPGGQAQGAIDILIAKLRDGTDPAQHDTYLTPVLIDINNIGEAERAVEAGVVPAATPSA